MNPKTGTGSRASPQVESLSGVGNGTALQQQINHAVVVFCLGCSEHLQCLFTVNDLLLQSINQGFPTHALYRLGQFLP